MPSISAERVRKFRKIRREAGLVELRIWVTQEDKDAVLQLTAAYAKKAVLEAHCQHHYGPNWRKDPKTQWLLTIMGELTDA